jgi:cell division protein FtsQ
MTKRRGLPLPPEPDLLDLPLGPGEESPFLRPRRRARLQKSRRNFSSRAVVALRILAGSLTLVAALWLGYARVMASDRLRVGKVEVSGQHFLSEGEVRELLGPAVGENILGLDIAGLKARLRSSPWVADATVSRTLPDTLRVTIRERVPLALAEVDRLYLMDGDGGLIDIFGPRTAAFDLPIVRGLAGLEGEARRDRAERAGALLRDLGDAGSEISEVFVLPSGDVKVVLRGPGETLLLGAPPCRNRFLTFLGLRKELAERAPRSEYFDLRFRGRIYAKPATAVVAPPAPASETIREGLPPAPAHLPSPGVLLPPMTALPAPAARDAAPDHHELSRVTDARPPAGGGRN